MAAGRVRWLPGADPGADVEEARRITRAVEGGTVAQWNTQQHQHLPTNSLFYDLAPHQADTASFFAADYIPQWLSHPSTGLRRQTPPFGYTIRLSHSATPFCYAILMLLPIIQNVRNLINKRENGELIQQNFPAIQT